MLLATWNVLHRIHAENWLETAVLARFPEECTRIAAITARVHRLLQQEPQACVCLQEVSGDLLVNLRRELPGFTVCSFGYPRLPRLKREAACSLEDVSEHLATIARHATVLAADSFHGDPGKGFLVVDAGGVLVVNTHASPGRRRRGQLTRVAAMAAGHRTVICGDFNARAEQVLHFVGDRFELVSLGSAPLPTRPDRVNPERIRPAIDHILVHGLVGVDGRVVDTACESDHNLVLARLADRQTFSPPS